MKAFPARALAIIIFFHFHNLFFVFSPHFSLLRLQHSLHSIDRLALSERLKKNLKGGHGLSSRFALNIEQKDLSFVCLAHDTPIPPLRRPPFYTSCFPCGEIFIRAEGIQDE